MLNIVAMNGRLTADHGRSPFLARIKTIPVRSAGNAQTLYFPLPPFPLAAIIFAHISVSHGVELTAA
jgi:hypothetical protein